MRYKVLDLEFPPTILLKAANPRVHPRAQAAHMREPARTSARARVAALPASSCILGILGPNGMSSNLSQSL